MGDISDYYIQKMIDDEHLFARDSRNERDELGYSVIEDVKLLEDNNTFFLLDINGIEVGIPKKILHWWDFERGMIRVYTKIFDEILSQLPSEDEFDDLDDSWLN